LIFLAKIIVFLKKLFSFLLSFLLVKPGALILRIFFYKVAVKIYGLYLSIARKLGWSKNKTASWSFIFDQKLIHITVITITFILVFSNLTSDTKAQSLSEANGKTILSSLIQNEFGSPEEAQLIVETFDQEATISPTQQNYLDNLVRVKSQPIAEMKPSENQDTDLDNRNNEGTAILNPGIAETNKTKQDRHEIIAYKVEPGDTISTIAQQFDIGVNTILWANDLNAYSVIRPGDSLKILPVSGVLHNVASGENLKSIASMYGVNQQDIQQSNNLGDGNRLTIGQKLIIPGGKKGSFTDPNTRTYSGIALLKDLIKPKKNSNSDSADASDSNNIPQNAAPGSSNKMHWPTSGYRITQYFSWKHFAVDIADHIGTPLYAADSGVVETAGWGTGYGNQIVVNHGGGKKTRYAHLSKFYVSVGDKVTKGQTIGAMGSTGWSTGSHIHFEVIINGVKYNPLNYVR